LHFYTAGKKEKEALRLDTATYVCVCVSVLVGGILLCVCVCVNGRPAHNKQISSHGNAYEQRTNKQATRPATTATQHQHQQRQQPQWYNFISEL